jgi:hypothetical protein
VAAEHDRAREADPLAGSGERIVGDPFDGFASSNELPALDLDLPARAAPATPAPVAAAPPLDLARVAAIADYGPPPGGILACVPYAALVLTRRRALSAALIDLRRLEKTAERDREEALIALGRALHAARDELAPLTRELAAADEAGQLAGQRAGEWEEARRTAESQRASLDAKIAEAARAALPYRDRETKLATQMEVRETDLRRAKARLSRAEIELRNLAQSQADASRSELLEAERVARQAEASAAQAHVDELAPKLAEARRELAVLLSAENDLRAQRRAVDALDARSEHAHHGVASEAERAYHAAVVELASQALARSLADRVAPDQAKAAQRMRAAFDTRAREVALHEAALVAYDRIGFQKGAALIAGAAFIVLITLLFVILR